MNISHNLTRAAFLCFAFAVPLSAADYHVAKNGNDTNPGTQRQPWKTLHHATKKLSAGDTLQIHSGIYNERLKMMTSGNSDDGSITVRNAPGETVVLDGTGITVGDQTAMVEINGQSFITIQGLKIRNLQTTQPHHIPIGIYINGASKNITIANCVIHDIASKAPVNSKLLGRDAHGIAVYGDSSDPISKLKIIDNTVYQLTLGSSEAVVVNGNVDGFEIRDNTVRDCDNIGIDCIGFEKVSPHAATDQARNGIVAGNQVYNIATKNNPAYDGESSAGGIYVDGGDSIVIERNHVHHCDFGIEVASEHKGKITRQITVRNNLLRENLQAGLIMGGYNRKTTGAAEDCIITNNTFYNNDTVTSGDEWGQIYLQFRVSRCTFANNILYHDISKGKQFNVFIVHWNTTGSQNSFDHNQFYGPATPVWILKNKWKEGWPEYLADSVSGTNEQFGDPLLTGVSGGNWMPAVKSPVVDSGSNAVISTNEIDFDGQPRIRNRIVDRGAAEYFGP